MLAVLHAHVSCAIGYAILLFISIFLYLYSHAFLFGFPNENKVAYVIIIKRISLTYVNKRIYISNLFYIYK